MATVLLIIIYIAFIGLGIPDSLFGTAWPAIYMEFNLPVSAANYVTFLISGGTIISSLLSARLINRYGTAKITAVSTTITAAALLGFSYSNGIFWLCLCAIPLGLGAGAIDSALNNYIALHYKAMHMNFLHCFYGIGVSLSPYLMSLALSVNCKLEKWISDYILVSSWNCYSNDNIHSIMEKSKTCFLGTGKFFCFVSGIALFLIGLGNWTDFS